MGHTEEHLESSPAAERMEVCRGGDEESDEMESRGEVPMIHIGLNVRLKEGWL